MPLIKEITINDLQPTQEKVSLSKIEYYSSIDPNLQKIPLPEAWKLNGTIYLADGHHRTLSQHLKQQSTIQIKIFTPQTCNIGAAAYTSIIEEILADGKNMVKKRITHISQLELI